MFRQRLMVSFALVALVMPLKALAQEGEEPAALHEAQPPPPAPPEARPGSPEVPPPPGEEPAPAPTEVQPPQGYHPVQAPALTEPPPSRGTGLIISGSILLGVGVLNLATAPICKTSAIRGDLQDTCLYLSLGLGGTFVAVGTPLLVVGVMRRSRYKAWQRNHPYLALLEGVGFSATSRGGGVLWRGDF